MYYSLRNKNLQKKNKKNTIKYLFLTIVVVVIFSIVGIKILVNIISVITDVKKSDTPQSSSDSIPPMVPYIYPVPEYTTSNSIDIKGNAEASSTVILTLNNHKSDTIVGNTGNFLFKIELIEGLNEFYLYSKDSSGNTSSNSKTYKITLDKISPVLDITSPQNNTTYSGSKNKILEIKGVSEKDATVTINDRFVYTNDDGSFNYKFELNSGENQILVKSIDLAGNEAIKNLTIIYQE